MYKVSLEEVQDIREKIISFHVGCVENFEIQCLGASTWSDENVHTTTIPDWASEEDILISLEISGFWIGILFKDNGDSDIAVFVNSHLEVFATIEDDDLENKINIYIKDGM